MLVVPWSAFWERNYFVGLMPAFAPTLLNHYVRGAVSGIGLVCLGAAASELVAFFVRSRRAKWVAGGDMTSRAQ